MNRESVKMDRASLKSRIAARLRIVRLDHYGDSGCEEMARQLDLPDRTWRNYENGVTIPGEVLLRFLTLTGTEPRWLLSGDGPRSRGSADGGFPESARQTWIATAIDLDRASRPPRDL